ncbi:MAG: XdhC family protein, partial [Desulfovibrionaceae bacterium]|nr:XdhC family protein [Desulfovibrionaceae bacterium]
MLELLRLLCDELKAGRPVALATIVFQEGSAPRGAGSKLLAGPGGLLAGTTGGGLAEARAIAACAEACNSGRPTVVDFVMDGTLAANSEMICGGRVRLLIEPFLPQRLPQGNEGAVMGLMASSARRCRIVRPFPPNGTGWTLLYDDGTQTGQPLSDTALRTLRQAVIQEADIVA